MFQQIIASAHLAGLRLVDSTRRRLVTESERGSYTVELVVVLAAIALIAIAVTGILSDGVKARAEKIFTDWS